ncbi:UNVERIFIED_CONTAM: hypothetical protein K2H54_067471 [Gekko kuhli]
MSKHAAASHLIRVTSTFKSMQVQNRRDRAEKVILIYQEDTHLVMWTKEKRKKCAVFQMAHTYFSAYLDWRGFFTSMHGDTGGDAPPNRMRRCVHNTLAK